MGRSIWDSYTEARISRRRLLKGSALAGSAAGAAWLLGCTGGSQRGKPPQAELDSPATPTGPTTYGVLNPGSSPQRGGRYRDQVTGNFDSFDPHLGVGLAAQYFPRIYNVLVNQSSERPEFITFDLAQSFENPDGVTWNFKIRPGVRIAPNDLGVPDRDMSAADVLAAFDRIKSEARATNGAFAKQYIERVTGHDDIVSIQTTRPYAWALSRVGNFFNTIPPRELLSEADAMRTRGAGGGPFRLTSSTESEGARLDRNPAYYGHDPSSVGGQVPFVDGMDVTIVADRSSRRTGFLSGQFDTYSPLDRTEAADLARRSEFFLRTEPAFYFISANMHPDKAPFRDARARRALSRAIDRKQYVDLVYGGDARANGLVHWPLGSYALDDGELATLQPFDLADARDLAGASGGIKVELICPVTSDEQHDKHLPIFLEQMRAAGIEIDPRPQDYVTWLENFRTLNYTLSLSPNQEYDTPELPLDFHVRGGPLSDGSYVVGLGDPEIEAAVRKTKETVNLNDRIDAVHAAQRVIYGKDPASLPLVSPLDYTAYNRRVRNVPTGIGTSAALVNTWYLDGEVS